MDNSDAHEAQIGQRLYHAEMSDPAGRLVDTTRLSDRDVQEVNRIMSAMGNLRHAEERLSRISSEYMKLNTTDMRALHFIMVCENAKQIAKPRDLAEHLNISTASTTKMLDRLEHAGHIRREPHPQDRRSLSIVVTPETREAATQTVGAQHAKRFIVASSLSSAERAAVAKFLEELAAELTLPDDMWR